MMKPNSLLLSAIFLCALLFRCTEDDPEIDITDIQFEGDKVTVTEGFTYDLTTAIEVTGSDADQAEISFSSSDVSVVSVSGHVLTAEKVGSTTVTATEANSGLTASIEVEVIANIIAVTGVVLDESEANLKVGETLQLVATISPEDATEKDITWSVAFPSESKSSEDEPTDIVTVSETGLVTAVAAGDVIVTATTNDGGFTASISISVTNVAVTGISLSASSLSVNIGETGSLVATITPSNATNKNVIWSLTLADEGEPESYATIDAQSGEVTGVSECDACGLAIVATTEDGAFTISADLFIVYVPVTGISIDPSSFSVEAGETQQLEAIISPENASNKNVTWSLRFTSLCDANPEDYATVSLSGLVTGIAPEICDIEVRATAENETRTFGTSTFNVSVTATSVAIVDSEGNAFSSKQIDLVYYDPDIQLYLEFSPSNATNTAVTWESDDPEVVEVNSSGAVSGLSSGTARITVTLNDGSGLSDYVDVTFSDI
ncbi:MAG: Ig-like domain-containing protein [Reichenbachiella sp.]|uniref:Ig-like domain-containing protein n=1 Tax=Reichenbachiella sp. TaxID=2184521 RepID=UPI0032987FA4